MNAVLDNYITLEELSIKRLQGIIDAVATEPIGPSVAATLLKTVCLKELYNKQCFKMSILDAKNLSRYCNELQGLGFERGWGDTTERVSEMVHLLLDIRQAPNPNTLGSFLGRISMVSNVIIVSPHGYFGQANILGFLDT
ncbi:hypothetical protein JHK87_012290 [Glycine soja]|nr:hypothetical protein JHK87_012290 [Glycine soja]